jgi:hypothetical protein
MGNILPQDVPCAKGWVLLIQTPRPAITTRSQFAPMRNVILRDAEALDGSHSVREIGTPDQGQSTRRAA